MTGLKEKKIVKLRARGRGASHSRADSSIPDLGFAIDAPLLRGAAKPGQVMTQTSLAALAGCTNVIGHKCATKLGADIGELTIEITCELDRRSVTLEEKTDVRFAVLQQVVNSSGAVSGEELQKVAAETAKCCPLSKLFQQAGMELETVWQKA
ncbi:OsmC family protein [Roseibium sp. RKSG952]|uniref:OsmC family protein n=1 Tax=Roseibium sp. RKSG952 TaxID=2529384 RepID=UPI0012BC0CE0|nr:OsmC family protein [Roseibium sp. RKSG952]MTH99090.1 OsmC family peroxiredoxin [Roseibium sp. RKSG952]